MDRRFELDARQADAVAHRAGPLLVVGGPGTGKSTVLVERLVARAGRGEVAADRALVLCPDAASADALRSRVEGRLDGGWAELRVTTTRDFGLRFLREEAVEAGIDPFCEPASPADRVALLAERLDELTLRAHDFRGRPVALLASIVARIDALKAAAIGPQDVARWAQRLPLHSAEERSRAAREQELAAVYAAHDRLLARRGLLDPAGAVLGAVRLLGERPHVRARLAATFDAVLVDDLQDLEHADVLLMRRLVAAVGGDVTAAGDDDAALTRSRAAGAKNLRDFADEHPDGTLVRLERSFRSPAAHLAAARAVLAPVPGRLGKATHPAADGGSVALWRCRNERAQAQAVAAEVERLVAREGVAPGRIAVLVRSLAHEGRPVAVALEERAVPHAEVGADAFFARAEVRDVLAWLRALLDPSDGPAVARVLSRPPVRLGAGELARAMQIAKRRKLDLVSGVAAALDSPQLAPEGRDRIREFLAVHRSFAGALDTARADVFVHRLIERLGLRREGLFAAQADAVERLRNLSRLGELASAHVRRGAAGGGITARDFARLVSAVAETGLPEEEALAGAERDDAVRVLAMDRARGLDADHVFVLGLHASRMPGARSSSAGAVPDELLVESGLPPDSRDAHVVAMRRRLAVAMTRSRGSLVLSYAADGDRGEAQPPSPFVEEVRAALGAPFEEREEELFGPAETLHATFRMMRDELLDTVQRTGSRLGELRFDTELDVSHAVVRLLEAVKLSALLARPEGQSVADALPGLNARLLGSVTAEQRDIFLTSALDELLLDAERDERQRAAAVARRAEPSLEPFLPRRDGGLVLSASDIEAYRTCPLRYKFARVLRIPTESTLNQRFGIAVHQVLERFYAPQQRRTPDGILELLDHAWRRGGFGDSDEERQLRGKARDALVRHAQRAAREPGEPAWLERAFAVKLGGHLLRGRVDRVDRLPGGGFELIDYKTGKPRSRAALREDVQLSLYARAAREAWQLEEARQSYVYVLDDEKVEVPTAELEPGHVEELVAEVAEGISGQGFEPTPSFSACSTCDFRIACPAAER